MIDTNYSLEEVGLDDKQQLKSLLERVRPISSMKEIYMWRKTLAKHTTEYSLEELEWLVRLIERAPSMYERGSRWYNHWYDRAEESRNHFNEFVEKLN